MPDETIADVLRELAPAVEAVRWLHDGLADVLVKLNEEAPEGIVFTASLDNRGDLHVRCHRQMEQPEPVAPPFGLPPFQMPFPPFGMNNQEQYDLGHFSLTDGEITYRGDDHYSSSSQNPMEVRGEEDVERVVCRALRQQWSTLFGMLSEVVYGDRYAAAVEQYDPVAEDDVVEEMQEEMVHEEVDLDHLVIAPRISEW